MMVLIISQCEKNALKKTRQVLDAFADRIGDNTWQTVITEEGLLAVKKLLRKTASKNTAVACHWLRSRSRRELVWIVGNRERFNTEGVVAVNSTKKKHTHAEWENDWIYLPVIKALAAMAALLHDWGKATALFQKKLESKTKQSDPIRHEWISYLLLHALVSMSGNADTDEGWLSLLSQAKLGEDKLKEFVSENNPQRLKDLPPIAQLVGWLIITHHRLPNLEKSKRGDYADRPRENLKAMLQSIRVDWGYKNGIDNKKCFEFPEGLLSQSSLWVKQLQRWATEAIRA